MKAMLNDEGGWITNFKLFSMQGFDLEDRLVDFAVQIIKLSNSLKKNSPGYVLTNQLVKSGTSAALNYAEAQSAESRRDFIHKMRIVLK